MIRQLAILALVGLAIAAPADKIASGLKATLASNGQANVMVSFQQDTDIVLNRINSMRFASRGAKITTMKSQLEQLSQASQQNALNILSSRSASHKSFWINNKLSIKNASPAIVAAIAALSEVTEVREELIAHIPKPIPGQNIEAEWGIDKIQAEQAWALPGGNNGAGVVVSLIDTGSRVTHEALRNNYRNDYGWFDPYNGGDTPVDIAGHGTHCVGTIAGSHGIGVAPGAQWISCRGCNVWDCSEAALVHCAEWIACPTLGNGTNPDCSKAPDVCSNSWGIGQDNRFYMEVVKAWHTAGVVPVFANHNYGSGCSTVTSPGDYDNVIGVGATDVTDTIAGFSSRGPSVNGTLKPDVSAPGVDVRSAGQNGDSEYVSMSGTSMATPHTAGTVALLLSRNPNLTYEQVKELLQANSDRQGLGNANTCAGIPPTQFPNNVYGWGRINARKALEAAINRNTTSV